MTDVIAEGVFQVNYAIRPAKCIERKMIAEALHRLGAFHDLKTYQYIGFGSAFFSDFILVHKSLCITDMVSIEKDEAHEQRYKDNCPYNCIDLRFGLSNTVLSKLSFDKPVITWLDYTCRLNDSVLEDVRYVCSKAKSGSVLIVTVNADSLGTSGYKQLTQMIRTNKADYQHVYRRYSQELGKWAVASTYRQILHEEVGVTLRDRNGVLPSGERINCQQIFNFEYLDTKRMLTYGGVLYKNDDENSLRKCRFETCHCYKPKDEPYRIEVPILTLREMRMLDAQLPKDSDKIKRGSVPESDVRKYTHIYRYFPSFVEAEL
jgi:hypothetical protein